ncbi:TetR/AcrR family transcriptional regulator [Agromyces sp. MMS24-JH15]|uniref:TetR/AcrR family transcriptional regulator n=1 Tax=Agromyces sp. MMS24-JH15 TaxID=3243765 RepID=UPI0037490A0E
MNTRPYRMTARAREAELTGERIVDAMLTRLASTPYEHVRIEDVAADAGVTGQTVIRRFGTKAALMNATVERELARIVAAREAAAHASPVETIHDLVVHYERYGALILKTYSESPLVPGLPEITARGRAFHVDWCRRAFTLPTLPDREAARRSAQIVAICDATTWRILRFDGGLEPAETELALEELILPLLA